MFSYAFINSHSQMSEPGPEGPLVLSYQASWSYFSTKTYVVGTQKNRLNETVLLSTQNTCLNGLVRK